MNTHTAGRLNAVEDDYDDLESRSNEIDDKVNRLVISHNQTVERLDRLENRLAQISKLFNLPGKD